jgi:hypothetical protein
MAVARLQRVIHVECPTCHWTRAVLAYKLVLLNHQPRLRLRAIVQADPAQPRLSERSST